jgi:hypothetical protein
VAVLAGVGVTWYTWLEQGRDVRASRHLLDRLSRALRLGRAEAGYLRDLALARDDESAGPTRLSPAVPTLLRELRNCPAFVHDDEFDIVAFNEACSAVLLDLRRIPKKRRNLIELLLTERSLQARLPDWERQARHVIGRYRALAARTPARMKARLAELHAVSSMHTSIWDEHEIVGEVAGKKRVLHPTAGELSFDFVSTSMGPYALAVYAPSTPATEARVAALVQARTPRRFPTSIRSPEG